MKLKRIIKLGGALLMTLGLASCSFFVKDAGGATEAPSIVNLSATGGKPAFNAYSKVGNKATELYYFNIGMLDGSSIASSDAVKYFSDEDYLHFTLPMASAEDINYKLNSALRRALNKPNMDGYYIAKGETNSSTKTTSYTLAKNMNGDISSNSLRLNGYTDTMLYLDNNRQIEHELSGDSDNLYDTSSWGLSFDRSNSVIKANEYSKESSGHVDIHSAYSSYINSSYNTIKEASFRANGSLNKGYYYRYSLFMQFNIYLILIVDNSTKNAYVDYRLYPVADSFYYGLEESTNSEFNKELDSKIIPDIADLVKYLNFNPDEAIKTSFKVSFNTNGGSVIPAINVKSGERISRPSEPTRDGFSFMGWYTDSSLSKEYDFNSTVKNDLTLYAKWVKNEASSYYNVSFVSNGGSSVLSQRVKRGYFVLVPDIPQRAGYKFTGWYTNSSLTNKYGFNTPVNSDLTLYAGWTKIINDDNLDIRVGDRKYYSDGLGFSVTLINNTGATIYGVKDLTLRIEVGGIKRAEAYFKSLNIPTIYEGEGITTELFFPMDTIDVDFWDNNRGNISMHSYASYNLVH